MNWMRTSPTNYVKKLWGRIHGGFKAGKYTLIIKNNYNVSNLNTDKFI